MAIVQVNPPGMSATAEGYISSVTVYTGGAATPLAPNATTGQITVSAKAATQLVQQHCQFKLIQG